ncbi:MAG: alcohol dehydrogenase [Chloroflexi bacterium RBG_13_51_52]|nr:MAG: alcohol dehydrogenase [Chloroflexi bacterium RBG_13_51_52]
MRVAVWYNNHDIRIEERPVPRIGPGEVLVRIIASGICGSDVMEWYRIDRAPLILGHEIAGEVVEVGKGVEKCKVGDRVAVAHHVPCNTCHYCLSGNHTSCDTLRRTNFDPGGFAEYVRLPAINVDRGVFPLPDDTSFEKATFIEPLACVLRGQRKAGIKPGQSVLVIGSGISGLLHVQLARALGVGHIIATDINEYRLKTAEKLGADTVFDADTFSTERFREINNGYLADVVIVCTGAVTAVTQALASVERGGTVLFFAPTGPGVTVPLSINDVFWRTDVTLTTSYAGSPADYDNALKLIQSRRVPVQDMITHRLGMAETGLGFKLVAEAGESLKVIIMPQQ